MGLFIKKEIKGLLDKGGLWKSRLTITGCIILVVCNILGFALLTSGSGAFLLIVSNVLTVVFTFLAFAPANEMIQRVLVRKQRELEDKASLQKRIEALERENDVLAGKVDTRVQTDAMLSNVNFTFKLEQMEYSKKGYIVKETEIDSLIEDEQFKDKIPQSGGFTRFLEFIKLKEKGMRKILYIKKAYYKASIGIDFGKIKYAINGDYIYFAGVRFTKLHDISSELEHDSSDIEHSLIINETEGGKKIETDLAYDEFIKVYGEIQGKDTRESIEKDVEMICGQYTDVLQGNLARKFKFIRFVKDEEVLGSTLTWHALRDGSADRQIAVVASNMLMLADVINQTQAIDDQEII